MATGTAGTVAREFHTAQTHYLTKAITYADNGSTLSMGYAPAGAIVVRAGSAGCSNPSPYYCCCF